MLASIMHILSVVVSFWKVALALVTFAAIWGILRACWKMVERHTGEQNTKWQNYSEDTKYLSLPQGTVEGLYRRPPPTTGTDGAPE